MAKPSDMGAFAAPSDVVLQRRLRSGFLLAWCVFWLLMTTMAVQDHLRQGPADLWKPLLWEGAACLAASVIAWLHWRRVHQFDHLLARPWRWFGMNLIWVPVMAVVFVAAVYGVRHAVHAAVGEPYRHAACGVVFRYEMLNFTLFYLLFIAILFGIRSYAAMSAERVRAERSPWADVLVALRSAFRFADEKGFAG